MRSVSCHPLTGARCLERQTRWALQSGLLLLLSLGCQGGRQQQGPEQGETARHTGRALNLLLITVDTLRADHLSAYGYSRATSPAVDALAAEGAMFEAAFAQRGLTWPSLTSIMTSLYPQSHGVRDNGQWLAATKLSFAELLQAAGYDTAAFLTNMTNGPNRGFAHREVFPVNLPGTDREHSTDLLATEAALRWLEARSGKRFFLWLHLLSPHASYEPPERFRQLFAAATDGTEGHTDTLWEITMQQHDLAPQELARIIALYDGEVAYGDSLIARLLARLDELGAAPTTLVVLSADHGEDLYQRHGYFFHQCSIYDSSLRIPLVFRLPGVIPAGRKIDKVVESIDIAPTVLELLGEEVPADFQGESLAPLLRAGDLKPADDVEARAFAELGEEIVSVRTPRWRYVHNPRATRLEIARAGEDRSCFPIAAEELYDQQSDPDELHNVAGEYPEVAADLRQAIAEWRSRLTIGASAEVGVSDEVLRELRALGYIQ